MSVIGFNEMANEILAAKVTPAGLEAPDQLKSKVAGLKAQQMLSPYQENLLLAMIHDEEVRGAAFKLFEVREANITAQALADAQAAAEITADAQDTPEYWFSQQELSELSEDELKMLEPQMLELYRLRSDKPATEQASAKSEVTSRVKLK